ncbi:MAG: ABC transporter ATP-binding protein/permease [Thermoleophilia bacterium]|nr:ABC transporter ATP-binding protein/permease [Thermoleophilia bacterium]MDH4345555.1 ABC transporter ATP-binding protein/permease [Thermoleophilia bacterium]
MSQRRKHRTGLSRLWSYTEQQRGRALVVMLLATVSAVAPVVGWHIVGDVIDAGIRAGDKQRLTVDVALYVGVNALAWGLGTATWLMLASIGQRMVVALRRSLFEHLTSLSLRYFSEQKAGWIIARLTSDVDALSDVLNQGLTTLVVNTLTLVAAVGGLFWLDWRLGLVALLVLPPGMLVTRWFQRTSHVAFSEVRTRIAAVTAQLAESVSGMAVVQAFNRERAFQREFDGLNDANRQANIRAQKLSSVFFPAIQFLGVVATAAVLFAGARMIDADALEIGTLVAAVGLLTLVFQPLQELSELYGQVQAAAAAMEKISTVLDAERDIVDRPGAKQMKRIDGRLTLDGVVFAYGEEPVIKGLTIDVPAGGCIALVGESGGGKSTTAKLIARFYDPLEGAVLVDDTDLRGVQLRSYRRQLGVVLQDPFLFSGTIADNIRFGRPDASDEEVEAAARAIGVDRVGARFEHGLEHVVREGGAGLSAGERQLISIARALLADPRILILDEATSNIDRPSEILIERAFDTLLQGRTSVIIAHRLATVRRADEILVIESGRIVQRGTEQSLLAEDGPFRRLAHTLEPPAAEQLARRAPVLEPS